MTRATTTLAQTMSLDLGVHGVGVGSHCDDVSPALQHIHHVFFF
jgi:hypothetical protein